MHNSFKESFSFQFLYIISEILINKKLSNYDCVILMVLISYYLFLWSKFHLQFIQQFLDLLIFEIHDCIKNLSNEGKIILLE